MSDEIVVVQRFTNGMEAQVAKLVLDAHGIPCVLLRDDAGGMLPSMHVLFPARLAVRREHADAARRILEASREMDRDAADMRESSWDDVPDADDDGEDDDRDPWR